MTLLLSSDNLLTGYEQYKLLTIQSKFISLCFISKRLITKFVYILNYLKNFKGSAQKYSTDAPTAKKKKKKAMLATAAHFKVSTRVRPQKQ